MLVEFKGQPELGIWDLYLRTVDPDNGNVCYIRPYRDVPPGLVTLANCATISVQREAIQTATNPDQGVLFT